MAKQDIFEAIEAIDPSLVEGKDKDDFTADELDDILAKAEMTKDILELDPEAEVDGLEDHQLEEMLDGLVAAADEAEAKAAADAKAEEEAKAAAGRVIGNARKSGPCRFSGITLAAKGKTTIDPDTDKKVGDSITLTDEQCGDQMLMSKLARNIGSGLLEWRD